MIIVTGATGKLGQGIAERLLERVPADQIGVSVRSPEKAAWLSDLGVRVLPGDFGDVESLQKSFEGASRVLIVSAGATGEAAMNHHRNAIDAARAVDAEHIFYTSHMGANPDSAFAPMPDHYATESELEASGLSFTSLRNGFYAASGLMLMGQALETGKLVAPEDGPVSWTDHADLAEAAAILLTNDETLEGPTSPLTALKALDLADLANLASGITGRDVERVVVSDDEFIAATIERGVPEERAKMLIGLFLASREGEFSAVDPTLEQLLGRPPISMREVIAASLQN